MTNSRSFLLIPPRQSDLAIDLGLPTVDDNIFHRVIRNPRIDAPNPRERECTEMLCAVLRNASSLRLQILRWLARQLRIAPPLEELEVTANTEGSIGSKRDDLRIEGFRQRSDQIYQELLWSIEIKVGAAFHDSSPLDDEKDAAESTYVAENRRELVNQIENYDRWLAKQPAVHRAGFVLSLGTATELLPSGLICEWCCVSWTRLGLCLIAALRDRRLPEIDQYLGEHMLGFIQEHLWRASEMASPELDFDDVALLRAFAVIGKECEVKINRLVEPLLRMCGDTWPGLLEISHQRGAFYGSNNRSVLWTNVLGPKRGDFPGLLAGVAKGRMTVWIESSSKTPYARTAVQSVIAELQARNSNWTVPEDNSRDLEIAKPLASILGSEDQQAAFEAFFRNAFEDLRAVGLIERIRRLSVERT